MRHRLSRFVQAEQIAALVEQHGFRRIEVLGRVIAEGASAEADDATARVADREHDAVAEAVVRAALIFLDQQPGFDGMPRIGQLAGQRIPGFRRVSDAEGLGGFAGDAALLQIFDRLRCLAKLRAVHAVGKGQRIQRPLQHGPGWSRAADARHLDASLTGQLLHGFRKAQPFVLHEEADRGAAAPRAEVEEHLLRRRDEERGRFLVGERRQGLELAAGAFEFQPRADHLDDIDAGDQVLDEAVWYTAAHVRSLRRVRP